LTDRVDACRARQCDVHSTHHHIRCGDGVAQLLRWRAAAERMLACAPHGHMIVGGLPPPSTDLTNTISASPTCFLVSVLKNRFLPRAWRTTSSSPGSKMGSTSLFHAAMRASLLRGVAVAGVVASCGCVGAARPGGAAERARNSSGEQLRGTHAQESSSTRPTPHSHVHHHNLNVRAVERLRACARMP